MDTIKTRKRRIHLCVSGLAVLWLLAAVLTSCSVIRGPDGRRSLRLTKGWPKSTIRFRETNYPVVKADLPKIADAEFVNDTELCATCHETYVKTFADNVHRQQKCEDCHGPASRHLETRGKEPGLILSFKTMKPAERSETCLKCHEREQCGPGMTWRTSAHANHGVSCTDCHTSHYNVPPGTPSTTVAVAAPASVHAAALAVVRGQSPDEVKHAVSLRGTSNHLGAVAPQVCYKCHGNMKVFETIAHPHQILGPNGFNCTTCHDPHGQIKQTTRVDQCLECHKGAPTMAWHSSVHSLENVACADCHNPHPTTRVARFVDIQHTNIRRPARLPMSVEEPEACYQCHQKIYGLNALPSHHPIKEGKMVCSDCHDAHGQTFDNLKEPTVNQVCYKCHAEKQGPFAYEHPPVSENCAICHEPHGTVANNLLRQPPVFLCLRCHSGHRTSPVGPNHTGLLGDVGTSPTLQRAFYSDCTQCHSQIHGSDLPTPHVPRAFMR